MLAGWGDPIGYLNASGVEEQVADAILEKAEEMRIARSNEYLTAMQNAVQNGVARAFAGGG